jgi:hypothetical protein
MKEQPGFLKKRAGTAYRTGVLILLLTVLVFTAGCESDDTGSSDAPSTPTLPTPVKTVTIRHTTATVPPTIFTMEPEPEMEPEETTQEPAGIPDETLAVSGNYHQEYIRMDATSYSVGEIVRFYLVNKGPEIDGCDYTHPPYTVYHLSPTGTRFEVSKSDPARFSTTTIVGDEPGTATGPFSIDTQRLSAGRYIIRFDCGNNVSREFVLKARSLAAGLI